MEMNLEIETNMETETETDSTRKWTWTWNWQTFAKYFIRRYILVAPLYNGNNDMKILKNSYRFWNSFLNDVLAELEISV
jgi:hypothetical protein